jgi:TetR/AcrR family transcriptional repressor of nem operon
VHHAVVHHDFRAECVADALMAETNMGRTSDAKEKLLAVAFDLIHEHSYGAVSVDHICKRAGVNKGSFYYFFKSKTDLVVAAYEEHWRLKEPDYERVFSKPKAHPPLETAGAVVRLHPRHVPETSGKSVRHVCGCPYTSVGGELATQDKKIRLKRQN